MSFAFRFPCCFNDPSLFTLHPSPFTLHPCPPRPCPNTIPRYSLNQKYEIVNLKSYDMKRTSTFLKLGLQGFVLIMTLYDRHPTPSLCVCVCVCVFCSCETEMYMEFVEIEICTCPRSSTSQCWRLCRVTLVLSCDFGFVV